MAEGRCGRNLRGARSTTTAGSTSVATALMVRAAAQAGELHSG